MSFTMKEPIHSGTGEIGEQWTVDRHLYLTEDRQRVVEEGDPEGRWLWAGPGRQVPLAQAQRLGAFPGSEPSEKDGDAEEAARAGEVADQEALATIPVEQAELKQAAAPENKMVDAPEGDKARPDAKTVRAWANDNGVEVPAKGRIPDDVMDAYLKAH